MTITISSPTVLESSDGISLRFCLDGAPHDSIIFNISGASRSFVPDTVEPALLGLLVPAMVAGQDVRLEGTISEELLFRITDYVIPLLVLCIPGAKPITVEGKSVARLTLKGEPAVLAGLSNGIDSLSLCMSHLGPQAPLEMGITHFVFHDVGSHGNRESTLTRSRLRGVEVSAQTMQRPLVIVRSNLHRFYRGAYQQTHTLRSAVVAFALGGRVRRFLYASTYSYCSIAAAKTNDIASADPILLPLLRSETLECFSVGASKTRVQKTALICSSEVAKKNLDVCVAQWPNCSQCWKCARTLLTLELLGKSADFGEVFDLRKFAKVRDRFVAHVMATAGRNPLNGEIRSLMIANVVRPLFRHRLGALRNSMLLFGLLAFPALKHALTRLYFRWSGFPHDH